MNPLARSFAVLLVFAAILGSTAAQTARPNILWITSEDHGPEMGCYGDKFATTPNVDKLAARSLRYTRVWSGAPVCAPARTTLITGMHASASGGEHMRSLTPLPADRKMFPVYLREAGYYTSNNAKEDYNHAKTGKVWDESSNRAHWRKRAAGQPFFAVFNSTKSHESQIRRRPHTPIHDPAKVRVPAYHPDTPEVRRDWAQYYDIVSEADADAGKVLEQLEADGLAGDTIIFYFGDHGSGMPRSKRWPCNSGLSVPLVVHIPEKFKDLRPADYQPGQATDRLVSFVDFGPAVLSLAGVRPPAWMQGQAFLGPFATEPRQHLHGFRARMDERNDLVRSVTDGRHVYIRNYMPHLIYGQHLDYMWQTPTTPIWEKLHLEGKLNQEQDAFWNRKPPEELYDLQNDPDEVKNLAGSPAHREMQARLRQAQQDHALKIRDLGFLPEGEMFARAGDGSPLDFSNDDTRYPLARILEIAELASLLDPGAVPQLRKALTDRDSAVRYWAVLGLLMRGQNAIAAVQADMQKTMSDPSPEVRVAAAQALSQFGGPKDRADAINLLLDHADWSKQNVFTAMASLNAFEAMGPAAGSWAGRIAKLPTEGKAPDPRYAPYVARQIQDILGRFKVQTGSPDRLKTSP